MHLANAYRVSGLRAPRRRLREVSLGSITVAAGVSRQHHPHFLARPRTRKGPAQMDRPRSKKFRTLNILGQPFSVRIHPLSANALESTPLPKAKLHPHWRPSLGKITSPPFQKRA